MPHYLFLKNRFFDPLPAALAFSGFIYLAHFGIENYFINTVFALFAIGYVLYADRRPLFWFGFYVGVFWFYWITLSFRFYDLPWLIPPGIIGIGLVYALLFYALGWLQHPLLKGLGLFALGHINPLGFNWLKPELILLDSFFSTDLIPFALFLLGMALLVWLTRYQKALAVIPLIAALDFGQPQNPPLPDLSIKLAQTNVPQDLKWEEAYQKQFIEENFLLIDQAIARHYELIVLPESAFPLHLNYRFDLMDRLKEKSWDIAIIAGGLRLGDHQHFNSAYFFQNGKMQIADKVVLVPFGERIPLPGFLKTLINDLFYSGAEDYSGAAEPTDFLIGGIPFRNAICYEATDMRLHEGNPRYMIAISNNGWFTPSTEPTLQALLMRLYARRYDTIIFHAANSSPSEVIKPYKMPIVE